MARVNTFSTRGCFRRALHTGQRTLLLIAVLLVLTDCAGGRAVFEGQNRVVQTLSALIEDVEANGDFETADMLYDAESELAAVCGPLQHKGYLRNTGEEVDLLTMLAAFFSLEDCEEATARTKAALSRLEQKTAASNGSDKIQ